MATPTIAIHNGTGSDTLASGAGPSTAVTGTAATTNTNTTVNIADAVALGGVATDGSAALWVNTTSGRQWSAITAISGSSGAWVVTVATAYTVTGSGRTWAIGGKRQTVDNSRQLFKDALAAWIIDLQQTGTDYTITASSLALNVNTAGAPITFTSTSGTRPVLSTSVSALVGMVDIASSTNLVISNLSLKYTGSGGTVRGIVPNTASAANVTIHNCVIDGFYNGIDGQNSTYNAITHLTTTLTEIKNCTNFGLINQNPIYLTDSYVHNNTRHGVYAGGDAMLARCRITNNGSVGGDANIYMFAANTCLTIINSTVAGAVNGPGVLIFGTTSAAILVNSIFWGNATYGVDNGNSASNWFVEYGCAYGANTTAARRGFSAGPGAVTLTGSPFNSSTDYGLNTTSGAGLACRNAGVTPSFPSDSVADYVDIGAVQHQDSGTNVASGQTLAVFGVDMDEAPGTNYATFDVRNNHLILNFDATTQETAIFSGVMPRNYGGGGITVYATWCLATATSGTAGWDVAFERIGAGNQNIASDGFATAQNIGLVTVPGTSGLTAVSSVAVTAGANTANIAAGELYRLRIRRNVSGTATGDLQLLGVELKET